jgi:hypothetical protein
MRFGCYGVGMSKPPLTDEQRLENVKTAAKMLAGAMASDVPQELHGSFRAWWEDAVSSLSNVDLAVASADSWVAVHRQMAGLLRPSFCRWAACQCHPALLSASVEGRQAAEGSYGQGRV